MNNYLGNTFKQKGMKLMNPKVKWIIMSKNMEKLIESIPSLTGVRSERQVIRRLEDLMIEKPRASAKEIEAAYKLLKILDNKKKRHTYSKEKAGK